MLPPLPGLCGDAGDAKSCTLVSEGEAIAPLLGSMVRGAELEPVVVLHVSSSDGLVALMRFG